MPITEVTGSCVLNPTHPPLHDPFAFLKVKAGEVLLWIRNLNALLLEFPYTPLAMAIPQAGDVTNL